MADIVVTEFMDDEAVANLSKRFDVVYDPDLPDKHPQLLKLICDCRALIVRNRTKVNAELLSAAPKLMVVGRLGVGLDNIDQERCRELGVTIVPAIGANETTVAEYVIAAMLIMLRRDTFHRTADIVAGQWPRMELKAIDARGKTLGLVGFGCIAREVAKLAKAFGMDVIAHSRSVTAESNVWKESGIEPVTFEALLARSNIVSVHVTLTPESRHLIDAAVIAKMRPGSYLINSARGGIVEEAAVVAALKSGELAGAVLDVFEQEPPRSPSMFDACPNLILTPHVAGYSDEANWRQGSIVAEGVVVVLQDAGKKAGLLE